MLERRQAAFERLRGLPNVRAVGVGLRERGGKLTGEMAFRVYVDAKVPRSELAPDEMIPETVEGIPTDVIQIEPTRKLCWDKGTRPLVGGIELTASPFDTLGVGSGTLGCIVTRSDGKLAVLSCEHVLLFKKTTDKRAWQPHYDSFLGFKCNLIGEVVDGVDEHVLHADGISYFLDGAIAVLDKGVDRRFRFRRIVNNAVGGFTEVPLPPGVEGVVRINNEGKVVSIRDEDGVLVDTTRIADTTANAIPGTLVWKIGDRSKLTVGVVKEQVGTAEDETLGELLNNVILINALAGYESKDVPLVPDGTPMFAAPGDSGSVVLDMLNRVVGIVTGISVEILTGENFAYACNIEPLRTRLQISVNASPSPSTPTAAIVDLPDERHEEEEAFEVDYGERLRALERRVRATGAGAVLMALVERHAAEMYELVNRRRAVMVVWHRQHGPAFVARFARALRDPVGVIPVETNGVPLRSMIAAMAAAFRQYGSPELRADVEAYEAWLLSMLDGCEDLEAFLARLDSTTPALST